MENEPLAYGAHLRGETIKIEVSPAYTAYFVHPGLLAQHSEYFKRALNGDWKESSNRVLKLDDVECETFELFLEWLYSQRYPKDERFGNTGDNRKNILRRLKACVFGDRFLASAFRAASENALIDSVVVAKRLPYYDAIIYAYVHLPSNSPVIQAFIDQHCCTVHERSNTEQNGELGLRSQLPKDFLVQVMLRYMQLQPSLHPRKHPDRCDYHGHTSSREKGKNCQVPRIDEFRKSPTKNPTSR